MHDRQRTRREPGDAVRIEDVIPPEILNDTRVDREYLEQVFREPQKFLPPRVKQEPEPRPEQPPQEPESRLARRAKLVGLVAAAALVAAAIIAASTMSAHHRTQGADNFGSPEITGAAALGGFAVPNPRTSSHDDARSTKSSTKELWAQSVADTKQDNPGPAIPAATVPPQAAPHSLVPVTVGQKLDKVRQFYQMVDVDPQHALTLLVPVLVGKEPGDLVRAWSSMDSIQVQEAEIQHDGSILAIVTMLQPDGSHLRITQLLRLADASGLISDARLISAQRM